MNSISIELNAKETHQKAVGYYQISEQYGYKFLVEVKKIRDEKLYKHLGFKDFESYTLESFGYTRETITDRISAAESWGDDYDEALRHYGKTKTNQIAQLPDKEREEVVSEGIPTADGVKTVEEATTREIEEYKRQIKQRDEKLAQQEKQIDNLSESLMDAHNKAPQVIKEKIEVAPADYDTLKKDNRHIREELNQAKEREEKAIEDFEGAKKRYKDLLESREETEKNSEKYKQLTEAIQTAQSNLTDKQRLISNYQNLSQLLRTSNEFLSKASAIVYQDLSEIISSDGLARQELEFLVERTERFLSDLRKQMNKKTIIEGEIIND